jgi:hypothetical protein
MIVSYRYDIDSPNYSTSPVFASHQGWLPPETIIMKHKISHKSRAHDNTTQSTDVNSGVEGLPRPKNWHRVESAFIVILRFHNE